MAAAMLLAALGYNVDCRIPTSIRRLGLTSQHIRMADDATDLKALAARMEEVRRGEADCKCVALRETLVPGQRLTLTAPPGLVQLFTKRDGKPVVILGYQRGGALPAYGVEAMLESPPEFVPVVPNIHPEGTANIVISATGRLAKFLQMGEKSYGLERTARVQWTDLDDEKAPPSAEVLSRSEALGKVIDEEWLALVRRTRREVTPTHLDDVLETLGPMPPADKPNARALWVTALINPLPAFGVSSQRKFASMGETVAPEIRFQVLTAVSIEGRLGMVEIAVRESLRRLAKIVCAEEEECDPEDLTED